MHRYENKDGYSHAFYPIYICTQAKAQPWSSKFLFTLGKLLVKVILAKLVNRNIGCLGKAHKLVRAKSTDVNIYLPPVNYFGSVFFFSNYHIFNFPFNIKAISEIMFLNFHCCRMGPGQTESFS